MINISIGKFLIEGSNRQELLGLKKEIFQKQIYNIDSTLNTRHSALSIIDAGAHVGLACLYFKQEWPNATITAIEPLPQNVMVLRHNIWQNQLTGITVVEAALSTQEGNTEFYFDESEDKWFSAASLQPGAWDKTQTSNAIKVNTIQLDTLLKKPVDLLKMDIEGSEIEVLSHSKLLHHADNIILELHPPNTPEEIQKIFRKTHDVRIEKHHYGLQLCYITRKK